MVSPAAGGHSQRPEPLQHRLAGLRVKTPFRRCEVKVRRRGWRKWVGVAGCAGDRTREHCALSAMLTVSQLSKSFAGRALFDEVSLQVNRGFLPRETRP
jgi:hypothetical protein